MNPDPWTRARGLARRAGDHKVVTGAASSVLAATVLGTWGAISGWISGDSPATAPASTTVAMVGSAGQPSALVGQPSTTANFEPLGFGTGFGPEDLPAGRRASPGQTIEVCAAEPLIGWFLHDLDAGSLVRLRWLHEGETIRVETHEVQTASTWYRVQPPVPTGQYVLEVEADEERASWSVYVQALDGTDAKCASPDAGISPTPG